MDRLMASVSHPVKPGGLSHADHEMIHTLGARKWSAPRIARQLNKHPSTVQWYMYCTGLKAPRSRENVQPHLRNGLVVRPFSAAEDKFILERRVAGLGFAEIAAQIAPKFGHGRKPAAVRNRIIMLASQENDA